MESQFLDFVQYIEVSVAPYLWKHLSIICPSTVLSTVVLTSDQTFHRDCCDPESQVLGNGFIENNPAGGYIYQTGYFASDLPGYPHFYSGMKVTDPSSYAIMTLLASKNSPSPFRLPFQWSGSSSLYHVLVGGQQAGRPEASICCLQPASESGFR